MTNLDESVFPIHEIKHLYAMRWGIETSFRELKYSVTLLYLHSKKLDFIYQEVFAKLTIYNFCQAATQSVVIQQGKKKHDYKVSFSDAVHVCLRFFEYSARDCAARPLKLSIHSGGIEHACRRR